MSTLHKVKAYFGMAPMEDYDDEYYDDHAPARTGGYPRQRFADDGYGGRYEGREYDDPRGESAEYGASYPPALRVVAARFHPWRARDGPAPDGDAVRREQPAVEDHHAAAQGLQRGPHHR